MYLVLCNSTDLPALWAYRGLAASGLAPIGLVSAEELVYGLSWHHRLGAAGPRTRIRLADGRTIDSDDLSGVLNRLVELPSEHLKLARAADSEYASQEILAFFMSWLHGLPCPVLNPPTSQGLSGRWRHPSEWAWLAGRAGMELRPFRQSTRRPHDAPGPQGPATPPGSVLRTAFVVEGRVVGEALPAHARERCETLARLSDTRLLGVTLAESALGGLSFVEATHHPDLRLGGRPLLDAIARALEGNGGPTA